MRNVLPATLVLASVALCSACTVHHYYPAAQVAAQDNDSEGSECAPLLPAPEALAEEDLSHTAGHGHEHNRLSAAAANESAPALKGRVIPHGELQKFENEGTVLVGLATASMGSSDFEIWRSSVPPGGATPMHVHDSEEVFVLLRGRGTLLVGDEEIEFEAPATVIAPASVPHQLRNTGDVPTDQIVIVAIGSEIKNDQGKVMELPWRE